MLALLQPLVGQTRSSESIREHSRAFEKAGRLGLAAADLFVFLALLQLPRLGAVEQRVVQEDRFARRPTRLLIGARI